MPLIARWPGKINAGAISKDLIDVSDFFPTFTELAGAELPADVTLDGRSFANRLSDNGPLVRDWVFAEHKGRAFVKDRRWKLHNDGRVFDLEEDPEEQNPLTTENLTGVPSSTIPKLAGELRKLNAAGLEGAPRD